MAQHGRDGHPTGFWFVFWGELAERASFYGMRTLLALYLVDTLAFGQAAAASTMQLFLAACYLTPLFGGWLADRRLGRYRTIAAFALPYIVGQLVLASVATRAGLSIALPLLALGSGAIKPNTSTLMGLIYEREKKEHLLERAFSLFYAAINVGSAVSTLLLPLVRNRYGYGVAFSIPAALMAIAFVLFVAGRRHYPEEDVRAKAGAADVNDDGPWPAIRRLAGVFLLVAVFWFVYDQNASTWVFFARDHVDLEVLPGISLTADQIQGINPAAIVVLTPVFNLIWRRVKLGDPQKMAVGFAIVVVAMAIMAAAGALASEGRVSVWWVIAATLVITLAELCISVIGLRFAFREAGPRAKSAVTAAFLVTTFIGDTFGGAYDTLYDRMAPGTYFAIQAAIIAVAGVAFARVAARFGEAPAAVRTSFGGRDDGMRQETTWG